MGGYGIGAGARDIHEEGLWIPVLKLYERGQINKTLSQIIKTNVRTPDAIFGDLGAQVASGKTGAERLNAMCDRYELDDIGQLADEIISRSEASTREAIKALPGGTFVGETSFDVPSGEVIKLVTAVTIDSEVEVLKLTLQAALVLVHRESTSLWHTLTLTAPLRLEALLIQICRIMPGVSRL